MESLPLESKIYRTIHEISPKEWESINSPNDIFHTYTFLKDVEDAKVENSDFWYIMIYKNGDLVGTAVLSAFIINLDIFIQADSVVGFVRKVWKNFLKIKILMCGIPASLGQKNIVIKDAYYGDLILASVSRIMNDIAKHEKIKYQAFKEFKENEIEQFAYLKRKGFFEALSLPYTRIEVKWKDFDTYFNELRHTYKRQILASLKKINVTSDFSLMNKRDLINSQVPQLMIVDSDFYTPELFYDSYLKVMNRATSKLETLNLDFFKNYFLSHQDKLIFIVLVDKSTIHGAVVLIPHETELTFALIGKNSEKDEYDTYFNLITAIVKYAIENNFETLNMGQTSYYPKLRVGAKPENVYIYFKSGKLLMHGLLKMLNRVLFPETKIKKVSVFKN